MRCPCAPLLMLCVALLAACQRDAAPKATNAASADDNSFIHDEGMTATAPAPEMNTSTEVPSVASGNASDTMAPRQRFISCPGDPRCRR